MYVRGAVGLMVSALVPKALFNTRMKIFLPFHIPKLVKSLAFYIPEA